RNLVSHDSIKSFLAFEVILDEGTVSLSCLDLKLNPLRTFDPCLWPSIIVSRINHIAADKAWQRDLRLLMRFCVAPVPPIQLHASKAYAEPVSRHSVRWEVGAAR